MVQLLVANRRAGPERVPFRLEGATDRVEAPQQYLRVYIDRKVMQAGGKDVVRATIDGGTLNIEWLMKEWAEWAELQQAAEFSALVQKATEKLAKSRMETSKGAGKGLHA